MPHVIIEYSANMESKIDVDGLIDSVHGAALETGVFPEGGLRTRAARRDNFKIADGHADNGFVHFILKIGPGRDEETKKNAMEHIFAAACDYLGPTYDSSPLGLSIEVQELPEILRINKNNLHEYVKARSEANG